MVNRRSYSDTVGLLESEETLGLLAGMVRSIISCEVDRSISVSNSGRYTVNNREPVFGSNVGACGFGVIRRLYFNSRQGYHYSL